MSMYLVSNEELNTLVRRRRLDVLDWVRGLAAESSDGSADHSLVEELLAQVEEHVRQDNIAYDYQEHEESPISSDEFAALEEDDGEDDTAIDFALAHVDEDDTLRLLDTAAEDHAPEVAEVEAEEPAAESVHAGPYPEFPSQHTEVAEYTAEDKPVAEPEVVAEPAAVAPALSEEERNKRNAARQRILNREIAQIDADR